MIRLSPHKPTWVVPSTAPNPQTLPWTTRRRVRPRKSAADTALGHRDRRVRLEQADQVALGVAESSHHPMVGIGSLLRSGCHGPVVDRPPLCDVPAEQRLDGTLRLDRGREWGSRSAPHGSSCRQHWPGEPVSGRPFVPDAGRTDTIDTTERSRSFAEDRGSLGTGTALRAERCDHRPHAVE